MDISSIINPSNEKKVAPFWSWNDKLNEKELFRQIILMKEQGYGGFYMHSRVGLVTGYLSDKWMELIKKCAKKADELGMNAWLYDEDKWPSGYASGAVPMQKEEYREKGIVFIGSDQLEKDDVIIKELDIKDEKKYIALRVTKLGNQWFNNTTYIDTLNMNAVKAFLDSTHEKYAEKMGDCFGKSIKGVFTDEPCTNMHCFYTVPFVPWSQNFEQWFFAKKGYGITEKIEELFLNIDDYQKTRYDFYDCVSEMFVESFTKQYAAWCEKHNLKLTGHFMSEENLIEQTCWMGGLMPNYEYMTVPGIDKLFNNLDQIVTLKQLTSVTEQLGKEHALSECFAGIGHDSGFITRKWIADWQAVNGINFVNPHLSAYSMRGERKRDYPPNLFYQQPWWEDEILFSDYIARLCELVSKGKRSVRILVIHPLSSAWCEFNPTERAEGYPIVNQKYNKPFVELANKLSVNRIDFHFGDEIIISRHASCENGRIKVGLHYYDTVIIPSSCNLRQTTFDKIKAFKESGGTLFTLMDVPNRIEGELVDFDIREDFHAETVDELITKLKSTEYSEVEVTDLHSETSSTKVISLISDTADGDSIILLANTDRNREIDARISIKRSGIPLLISLVEGKVYKIPFAIEDSNIVIHSTINAIGSIALIISKTIPEEAIDIKETMGILKDGSCFDICIKPEIQRLNLSNVEVTDPNILPLTRLTLSVDRKIVANEEHISKISHFKYYTLEDGAEFTASYHFNVKYVPEGEVFAAIEAAENLDEITINGAVVKPERTKGEDCVLNDKAWLDVSFTRVYLNGLIKTGVNELIIKGKKLNNITGVGSHIGVKDFEGYTPTEVETIYIVGDFKVFDIDMEEFYIDFDDKKICSQDIVKTGYPFYVGHISYKYNCILPQSQTIILKLSDYKGDSARCYVNGNLIGTTGFSPYIFNLTQFAGQEVEIEIVTANDLFNLMGPAYLSELRKMPWVDIGVFNDAAQYTKKLSLNRYGLGNAYLLFYKQKN